MKHSFILLIAVLFSSLAIAQQLGSTVTFTAVDGKTYTGRITEIQGNKYKVKYDGFDFEAWMVQAQFTITGNTQAANIQQNQQQNGNWQVGDKVEAYDMYNNKWDNGTITIVQKEYNPLQWRVTFDEPKGHTFEYLTLNAKQIRPKGSRSNYNFTVGSRVDAYYTSGEPKKRGTIIEDKGNGRFKVKYDGCADHWDEEVDWSQLKPESVVSATDPDITATFGKWAMFVYSYPNTYTDGDYIYRQYGTGAKAPPLQINANGTYVWYDEFNKPPVTGKWIPHAKIDGIKMGTEAVNGILIKDSRGYYWKVYKDRPNHIEARTMCSGLTQGGSRI